MGIYEEFLKLFKEGDQNEKTPAATIENRSDLMREFNENLFREKRGMNKRISHALKSEPSENFTFFLNLKV